MAWKCLQVQEGRLTDFQALQSVEAGGELVRGEVGRNNGGQMPGVSMSQVPG